MPTHRKSAPFLTACSNPERGDIAPAARTLNATHGLSSVFVTSMVFSGVSSKTLSLRFLGPADQ